MLALSETTDVPPAAATGQSQDSGFGWGVMILVPLLGLAVGYAIGYERGSTATPRTRRQSYRSRYEP